jgi:hypothetical protein
MSVMDFVKRFMKVSIPGKVDDILVDRDIKALLEESLSHVVEKRAVVIVTLSDKGVISLQYAGIVGDIGACGMLTYGLRVVQDGKPP